MDIYDEAKELRLRLREQGKRIQALEEEVRRLERKIRDVAENQKQGGLI